jgi:hypothetical protein
VLTLQPGTSPPLLCSCALGVPLLLQGRRWARTRAVAALIRVSLIVGPLLSALLSCMLLASLAVVSTAWMKRLLTLLPPTMQPPK